MSRLLGTPEIERKFLVDTLPRGIHTLPKVEIEQGYLGVTPDEEQRLRRVTTEHGTQYYATTKRGSGVLRYEHEEEITGREFAGQWPATAGSRIKKTRYMVPYKYRNDHGKLRQCTIEVDIFAGRLGGLCLAEIEFSSVKQSKEFRPPNWLSGEVTRDEAYSNRNLAIHGKPHRHHKQP